MTAGIVALVGVFGLLIGSFLNVVIWRVPRGQSVVLPRSRCPSCHEALSWYENIPVVSWLVLRGRCRHCGSEISVRYPAVELLTAALFVLTALRLGLSLHLPAYLYFAAVSIALAFIDWDTKKLPNRLVYPSYPVAVALLLLTLLPSSGAAAGSLGRALLGCVCLGAFYFLVWWIYPGGMGFGDVKLAGILGIYLGFLGWGNLAVGAFAGFVFGGLYVLLVALRKKVNRKTQIPFGPWMILGAWFGVFLGTTTWDWYISIAL